MILIGRSKLGKCIITISIRRYGTTSNSATKTSLSRRMARRAPPLGGAFWDAGAQVFIHKGVNGRWTEVLSAKEILEYEQLADAKLGVVRARWLAYGTCQTDEA